MYVKTYTIVYPLETPTYEPIDYNPFDIYSDATHISINSNIPAKIKVRNHGYNCMVKPNTTYTATYNMNGTAQKVTLTTGSILDDSIRFTGTGTLKNFLLLEGDISNPPAFFAGMRSSFDQEYDEVKGKWKVNVRVVGKNLTDRTVIRDNGSGFFNASQGLLAKVYPNITYTLSCDINTTSTATNLRARPVTADNKAINGEDFGWSTIKGNKLTHTFTPNIECFVGLTGNNYPNTKLTNIQLEVGDTASEYEPYTYNDITIYINEPLREGDIIRAENRKILVERHMGEVVFDGSADEDWIIEGEVNKTLSCSYVRAKDKLKLGSQLLYCNTLPVTEVYGKDNEGIDIHINLALHARVHVSKLATQDVVGFKQWLSENPTTIVYQLAEPVIKEVETDYTRLMLESYENATVYFNSHIFPTSTIRYQADVISTSEIMSVSDQQDAKIIDNATQIAMITLTM